MRIEADGTKYLDYKEVADELGLDEAYIPTLVLRGKLATKKFLRDRRKYVKASEVEAYKALHSGGAGVYNSTVDRIVEEVTNRVLAAISSASSSAISSRSTTGDRIERYREGYPFPQIEQDTDDTVTSMVIFIMLGLATVYIVRKIYPAMVAKAAEHIRVDNRLMAIAEKILEETKPMAEMIEPQELEKMVTERVYVELATRRH